MRSLPRNAILVTIVLTVAIIISASFTSSPPPPDRQYKNLKVLPKNINKHDLDSVMHGWAGSLAVKCDFCHAHAKDDPAHLDFASDEKSEKNIARGMFRMENKINKKFFKNVKDDKGNRVMVVACYTCHHGSPHPEPNPPKPGEIR